LQGCTNVLCIYLGIGLQLVCQTVQRCSALHLQ